MKKILLASTALVFVADVAIADILSITQQRHPGTGQYRINFYENYGADGVRGGGDDTVRSYTAPNLGLANAQPFSQVLHDALLFYGDGGTPDYVFDGTVEAATAAGLASHATAADGSTPARTAGQNALDELRTGPTDAQTSYVRTNSRMERNFFVPTTGADTGYLIQFRQGVGVYIARETSHSAADRADYTIVSLSDPHALLRSHANSWRYGADSQGLLNEISRQNPDESVFTQAYRPGGDLPLNDIAEADALTTYPDTFTGPRGRAVFVPTTNSNTGFLIILREDGGVSITNGRNLSGNTLSRYERVTLSDTSFIRSSRSTGAGDPTYRNQILNAISRENPGLDWITRPYQPAIDVTGEDVTRTEIVRDHSNLGTYSTYRSGHEAGLQPGTRYSYIDSAGETRYLYYTASGWSASNWESNGATPLTGFTTTVQGFEQGRDHGALVVANYNTWRVTSTQTLHRTVQSGGVVAPSTAVGPELVRGNAYSFTDTEGRTRYIAPFGNAHSVFNSRPAGSITPLTGFTTDGTLGPGSSERILAAYNEWRGGALPNLGRSYRIANQNTLTLTNGEGGGVVRDGTERLGHDGRRFAAHQRAWPSGAEYDVATYWRNNGWVGTGAFAHWLHPITGPGANYDLHAPGIRRDSNGNPVLDSNGNEIPRVTIIDQLDLDDIEQALEEAYHDGFLDGYQDGYEDGFRDGFDLGFADARRTN